MKRCTESLADQLTTLLEDSDGGGETISALVDFFDGMTERDRRALASIASQVAEQRDAELDERRHERNRLRSAPTPADRQLVALTAEARLAEFATQSVAAFGKAGRTGRLPDGAAERILAGRDPAFTAELVERYHGNGRLTWQLLRWAITTGRAQRPASDEYFLRVFIRWQMDVGPYELLTTDPALLDYELWKLFEVPGGREESFANSDRFARGGTWADALLRLVHEDRIDRSGLLDACLHGLSIAPNHFQARWFHQCFDRLEPSLDELDERRDAVIPQTSNPAPNVAKWAFEKLQLLLDGGCLDVDENLIGYIRPLLGARAAKTVKSALASLAAIAVADPRLKTSIAQAATIALSHDAIDAQQAAWAIIRDHPADDPLRSSVERVQSLVAPTLRSEVNAWLGAGGGPSPLEAGSRCAHDVSDSLSTLDRFSTAERLRGGLDTLVGDMGRDRFAIPSMQFDGTEIPRLDERAAITAINALDALIENAAHLLENPGDPDAFEQVLDGVARLHQVRPDDFDARTSPLRKRIRQIQARGELGVIRHGAIGVLSSWLRLPRQHPTADQVREKGADPTIHTFFLDRCSAVANQVAGEVTDPLLSAPTHQGGWIEPMTFVERVNARSRQPDPHDLHLAMLRLAPEGRATALAELQRRPAEWVRAASYALGSRARPGATQDLWVSASRARSGWGTDRVLAKASPHCTFAEIRPPQLSTEPRRYTDFATWLAWPYPQSQAYGTTDTFATAPSELFLRFDPHLHFGLAEDMIAWSATVWPTVQEPLLAIGTRDIARNLDWDMACWDNARHLDPLLDPGVPLRASALRLLMFGLAAKEAGEHGLATDAAIAGIADGRLGTDNLTEALHTVLPLGIKPRRIRDRFAEIAAASELHAHVVLSSILAACRGEPREMPRGFGSLLELALQLATELSTGVHDPEARAFLESMKGSSKGAKAARAALALEDEQVRTDLMVEALEHRIARLDAWASSWAE